MKKSLLPLPPETLTHKVSTSIKKAISFEKIIIIGFISIIFLMILTIYKMGKIPGDFSQMVTDKFLDYIHIILGALISWGTMVISSITRNNHKK